MVAQVDLNLNQQVTDKWGFKMTQRIDMYARALEEVNCEKFQPNIVREKFDE